MFLFLCYFTFLKGYNYAFSVEFLVVSSSVKLLTSSNKSTTSWLGALVDSDTITPTTSDTIKPGTISYRPVFAITLSKP